MFEDFAQRIHARVQVTLPVGWIVVTSGSVERDAETFVLASTVPLIDIPFAASPSLKYTESGRARVYYAATPPPIVPQVLRTTASCSAYLNARYGAKDSLPELRMVLAPRGGPGYARKNYIVITTLSDTASVPLQRFICHELAHYWSSGAIASGPENWLNESFAEFASARYVREVNGDAAYATIVERWQQAAADPGASAPSRGCPSIGGGVRAKLVRRGTR